MAKHKASTEVTVAPLFEKSALEQTLDKIKLPAIVLIGLAVAWILYGNLTQQASQRQVDESWAAFAAATTPDPMSGLPTGDPAALGALAADLKGTDSGPWARLIQAQACLKEQDYPGALAAIASLKQEYPSHPLVATPQPLADGTTATVADHLQQMAEQQQTWTSRHADLLEAPVPPESAPRVRLQTSAGDIEVALFQDLAPKHVENFLRLCSEGFYDGTRFHRTQADFMIQGGDPNSRGEDRTQWGQGGTDTTIPQEPSGLYHFSGMLSAAKKPTETESSGCQFFITTAPAHHLDGQHTVFGAVVSGMDVVQKIASAPLVEGTRDQPKDPVVLTSTEVQS